MEDHGLYWNCQLERLMARPDGWEKEGEEEGGEKSVIHTATCHCGEVELQVEAAKDFTALDCNCSVCRMKGYLHLTVKKDKVKMIKGQDKVADYRFNTKVASHTFCKTCGMHPYYTPRSNPDCYSINIRCIRPDTLGKVKVVSLEGRNFTGSLTAGEDGTMSSA